MIEPQTRDDVAKRIALTTILTFAAARHGLDLLIERGATIEQAETLVRLGVAPVAAELLDRMREDDARLHHDESHDLPATEGLGDPDS